METSFELSIQLVVVGGGGGGVVVGGGGNSNGGQFALDCASQTGSRTFACLSPIGPN